MLVKYSILLETTLITCQLNIYSFKRHDFILCFLTKMCLLILKNYKVVAIFKCLLKYSTKDREVNFAVLDRSIDFVATSKTRPNNQ